MTVTDYPQTTRHRTLFLVASIAAIVLFVVALLAWSAGSDGLDPRLWSDGATVGLKHLTPLPAASIVR